MIKYKLSIVIIILIFIIFLFSFNYKYKEHFYKKDLITVSKEVNNLIPHKILNHGSGDKGEHHHDYLYYYKNIISRVKPDFKLLEIGIYHGYSVVSFCRAYDKSVIYGVDIDLKAWNYNKDLFKLSNSEKKRLKIIKHDATKKSIINLIPNDLDVILDDGSHEPDDMKKTFEILFNNNLKDGGIYIIEDVHCGRNTEQFLKYVYSLFPYVYKFENFENCKMLAGRKNIKKRISQNWKYKIKDITISRDIVVITKEDI